MNSFDARAPITVGDRRYEILRLAALDETLGVSRLPYSLKVLLENLLRHEDGVTVTAADIEGLAGWAGVPGGRQVNLPSGGDREIAFRPARVLMQDFTGVPALVDLAALRDAVAERGGDPSGLEPGIPADLVIDHSVSVDVFGVPDAIVRNSALEFERNRERYQFLRWGQQAFDTLRVVPPATGICHQVNLEYLATVVAVRDGTAFPDTLVGTDSHTPMVNGLGVVGWGVGGIEAEAAMLGQPISMLIPPVVGFRLVGELPEGATATDLVLTVTERLRRHGVVGKFVEFYGPGVANVPLENRATIGNMSPEYGSTITIFPIDGETLRYLRFTGRPAEVTDLVEAYAKDQGLWLDPTAEPVFSETLELDLGSIEPSLAGPARPQDRVPLREAKRRFVAALGQAMPDPAPDSHDEAVAESFPASDPPGDDGGADGKPDPTPTPVALPSSDRPRRLVPVTMGDESFELDH
ncbi:MAG: aconitate hydratase, partial [Actinomycetota bacterium]|nr:aconitate hydratase [Actinomycetota bacterium]